MRSMVAKMTRWLGGVELPILLGLLVLAGGAWIFFWLAAEVVEGDTRSFDEWAILALRHPDNLARPIGPTWLAEAGRDVTALGSVSILVLLIAVVVGYLTLIGKFRAMFFILAATSGGFALSSTLKGHYRRPRPEVVPHLMETYNSSFPSGHSMMSAVVFLTLGTLVAGLVRSRLAQAYFLSVAIILTILVGVSRVFMGVHYPSDVLAGWTAGLVWATLCWLVERRLQRSGEIESATATPHA